MYKEKTSVAIILELFKFRWGLSHSMHNRDEITLGLTTLKRIGGNLAGPKANRLENLLMTWLNKRSKMALRHREQ